jgi:glycosyltransferase involved in cell wall biosynthesis
VPETLGNAGLVLDGDDLPLVAEALHEVVSSGATRAALAEAGAQRLEDLSPEAVASRIRAALTPILDGS